MLKRPAFPDADDHDVQEDGGQEGADQPISQDQQEPEAFNSFTDDEVQNLKEIFDLFDKEKSGYIEVKDLETIMGSLQRDPNEVREFVENIDPNSNGQISFEEFLQLM